MHLLCDSNLLAKLSLMVDPSFFGGALASLVSGEHLEKAVLQYEPKFGIEIRELYKLVVTMANCQEPKWDVINLVKQLKDKGYKVYIFSNISETFMGDLKSKQPEIFAYFDGIHTTGEHLDYAQKPSRKVFESFISNFVPNDEVQVIFIDDKLKNIEMARNMGMFGIQFISVDQVRSQLEQLIEF